MASKVGPQGLAALRFARHDDRQRSGKAGPNRYSAHREQDLPERMLDRRVVGCLLRWYFRLYHRIECHGLAKIPSTGPVLVLISHFSFLDGVALLAFDTRGGQTAGVIKESLLHLPLIGRLLHRWGLIAVARDGQDTRAVRTMLGALRRGRAVCIAAEGTRSRSGRLGPMQPTLMKLAVRAACSNVPVLPVAVSGSYEALPVGAVIPRPKKLRVTVGEPLALGAWCNQPLTDEQLVEVGRLVQDALAALLPANRQPAQNTPVLLQRNVVGRAGRVQEVDDGVGGGGVALSG